MAYSARSHIEIVENELRKGCFISARDYLGRRRDGLESSPGIEERTLAAEVLYRTGHCTEAISIANSTLRMGLCTTVSKARLLAVLAIHAIDQGLVGESLKVFHKAQTLARQTQDVELLCRIQLESLACLSDVSGPASVATRVCAVERSVAQSSSHPHTIARLHLAVAQIEGKRGNLVIGEGHLRAAERLLAPLPNPWLEGIMWLNWSTISALQADPRTGLLLAERALSCAEFSGHFRTKVAALGNLAYLSLWNHDIRGAKRRCLRGLSMARGHIDVKMALLETLAQTCLVNGQLLRSRVLLRGIDSTGLGTAHKPPSWYSIAAKLTEIRLCFRSSDWRQGLDLCVSALDAADERNDVLHQVSLRVLGADALVELGHFDDAARVVDEAMALAEDAPLALFAEVERVTAAVVACTVGRVAARRQFSRAARILSHVGGIAPRMDATASYQRTMQPADNGLGQDLRREPWRVDSIVKGTLPGRSGSRGFTPGRPVDERAVGLSDVMALARLTWKPDLLAQEAFVLLRESGHVASIAIVERTRGEANHVRAWEGWSVDAVRQEAIRGLRSIALPVGTKEGREVELLVVPCDDARSRAFVRNMKLVLQHARELQSFREAERTAHSLMPADVGDGADGVFVSDHMRDLVATAHRVAASELPVLITGETGTGKEVLARLLHKRSDRADRDFVAYNCTGVPKDMIESQLFGHRRGAFTGAREDSPGVIRAANGGTLLLDEIGEIAPDVQPKLLRFLDNAEVQPLGESRPVKVDVRIIAATNANLEELVRQGRFREDLLYRLNVITLDVPPLRNRREEILPLAHHLLHRLGREAGGPALRMTEDAEKCLLCFEWPGNVRRLVNEIRRAAALTSETTIGVEHLSPEVIEAGRRMGKVAEAAPLEPRSVSIPIDQPLSDAVMLLERTMIQRTLESVGGHVGFAAQRLGISRKGLYLKRQRLRLDPLGT